MQIEKGTIDVLGYHILLDLQRCSKNLLVDETKHLNPITDKIEQVGLTIVDTACHEFENKSWSAAIVLAESHVSIHTWPERKYVSADVFVCNVTRNNSGRARQIAEFLEEHFGAQEFTMKTVSRE